MCREACKAAITRSRRHGGATRRRRGDRRPVRHHPLFAADRRRRLRAGRDVERHGPAPRDGRRSVPRSSSPATSPASWESAGGCSRSTYPQSWLSTLAMPTRISAESSLTLPVRVGDAIVTGPAGDTINAADGPDDIDAGGAPYKGQESSPVRPGSSRTRTPTSSTPAPVMTRSGSTAGQGRDVVSGGGGLDGVTYAGRFPIGVPGQAGVNVSLNDVADDGDASVDPPDARRSARTTTSSPTSRTSSAPSARMSSRATRAPTSSRAERARTR